MDYDHATTNTGDAVAFRKVRVRRRSESEPERLGVQTGRQVLRSARVIQFLECLTVTAGTDAGHPLRLREWQKRIIRRIYDPVVEDEGELIRAVREALITMARKNGKTELCAGLVLCHLCGPESELNGQIYSTAADRNQAALIFNAAAAMVRADPELSSIINIVESNKRLVYAANGSFYQALSSESKTKHGFNASLVINDELAQAPNRKLYDTLKTSMGARKEPLIITISTQSDDPLSIMSELVEYGKKTLLPKTDPEHVDDPTFAAFIFESPAVKLDAKGRPIKNEKGEPVEIDLLDEEYWYYSNPALGDFRSLQEMRSAAIRAKRTPTFEPTFRLLYLNQAVDPTKTLISRGDWLANAQKVSLDQVRNRRKGLRAYMGLDLSAVRDLTGGVVVVEPDSNIKGDKWKVCSFAWLPEFGLAHKADEDRVPYVTWKDQGFLEVVPGKVIDLDVVGKRILEIRADLRIDKIVFDRWKFEQLKSAMEKQGGRFREKTEKDEGELVAFGQGFKDMAVAIDALERQLVNHNVAHGGNPILTWCVANAAVEKDPAGNRKFTKKKAKGRIDLAVAMAMAFGQFEKETKNAKGKKIISGYSHVLVVD